MSLIGTKRTCHPSLLTAANGAKADVARRTISGRRRHRFAPQVGARRDDVLVGEIKNGPPTPDVVLQMPLET